MSFIQLGFRLKTTTNTTIIINKKTTSTVRPTTVILVDDFAFSSFCGRCVVVCLVTSEVVDISTECVVVMDETIAGLDVLIVSNVVDSS